MRRNASSIISHFPIETSKRTLIVWRDSKEMNNVKYVQLFLGFTWVFCTKYEWGSTQNVLRNMLYCGEQVSWNCTYLLPNTRSTHTVKIFPRWLYISIWSWPPVKLMMSHATQEYGVSKGYRNEILKCSPVFNLQKKSYSREDRAFSSFVKFEGKLSLNKSNENCVLKSHIFTVGNSPVEIY